MQLEEYIRTIPDFPKPGIQFKDITTLLNHPPAYQQAIGELLRHVGKANVTKVVGIESRGFIFGATLADRLQAGFVPVRKKGKLPTKTIQQEYALEYGTNVLEIHEDAIRPGDQVLIHDDLLATGGTALAACQLVEQLGGEILQVSFLIELSFLHGREALSKHPVTSVISY
uniref:Adenine phosphoribosyltransferase n=1 Tax=Roseihalotalea indica TaxID=2867963 RepID=A0AA49GK69_9BACT|nr:adenine phosphoribosyltransferase [Tunicatimonas sp. TK19036]